MLTLKQWRLAKEISLEKMAKLLDVSMNTYIRWEKNPGKMPLAKAQAFANALGINFNDIIFLPNKDTECVTK